MVSSMNNLAQKFEQLVADLLKANQFSVSVVLDQRARFDFEATLAGDRWAVEVKYYRTKRAQPSLIEKAAAALLESARDRNFTKAMLVISSFLDPVIRESLENKFNIVFVDRVDLSIWANQAPHLLDPLAGLLEETPSSGRRGLNRIDYSLSFDSTVSLPPSTNEGADLCEELRIMGRGKKYWQLYESLCERILRYLFPNDLSGWHKQMRTDDGLNRYDLICRLSPTTDFWNFVDGQLASRYVLFEFKNYSAPIKQGQILTTEKYLLPLALRRLGIILSRKGADKSAQLTVAGAMRESGKMMLILDDLKICDLLHAKDRGDDPSDHLFQLSDDFLMQLNR